MTTIPGRRRPRFYERKTVVELLAIVPPVVTAGVTAYINLRDPGKRTLGWLLVGAIGWLAAASIVRVLHAHAQDREQKRRDDYDGLLGALYVLYGLVSARAAVGPHEHGRLRITIHRIVPPVAKGRAAEELEQLLPYLGGDGGGPGRRFSIRAGVIGRAVREKIAFAASRQNEHYEQFLGELVREYAYTEEDARQLAPDRRAWMAVPVAGAGRAVAAVVYLDSNERTFFTNELQKIIVDACSGITSYVHEAYR
ncbi:hypothetical protein [Longimicrobium sp.]|uniref:hypothetical protein n=1 Tax=Longimicrobium sp. TaxID=2029185 RepID=UPI002CA2D826|nr:hypothetical protein [Longimicrobium sp.]HSU15545.1 hypothetical protein [Longimicrobium sp.]